MSDRRDESAVTPAGSDHLNGWKEIAAYLGRGVRSAQRWEKALGFPIHRIPTAGGEVVFAYRSEIDRWRSSASSVALVPPAPETRGFRSRWRMIAGTCVALLLVGLISWVARQPTTPILRIKGQVVTQHHQGDVIMFGGIGFAPNERPRRSVRKPDGVVVDFEPVLAADPQGTLRGSIATDCATPVGRYAMWYVDPSTSARSNEVSWMLQGSERCRGEVADLIVESVSSHRRSSASGGLLAVTYQIRNAGSASTPPTRTRIRLGTSPLRTTVTDMVLGDDYVPALKPGTSVIRTVAWPVLPAVEGAHYVWIVADNDAVVPQTSAQNDFMRSEPLVFLRR